MAKVDRHESVTNHQNGGVDFTLLDVGDIVACIYRGRYFDRTIDRYVFDPNRDHPKAISHHRLREFPSSNGVVNGMVWDHLS